MVGCSWLVVWSVSGRLSKFKLFEFHPGMFSRIICKLFEFVSKLFGFVKLTNYTNSVWSFSVVFDADWSPWPLEPFSNESLKSKWELIYMQLCPFLPMTSPRASSGTWRSEIVFICKMGYSRLIVYHRHVV